MKDRKTSSERGLHVPFRLRSILYARRVRISRKASHHSLPPFEGSQAVGWRMGDSFRLSAFEPGWLSSWRGDGAQRLSLLANSFLSARPRPSLHSGFNHRRDSYMLEISLSARACVCVCMCVCIPFPQHARNGLWMISFLKTKIHHPCLGLCRPPAARWFSPFQLPFSTVPRRVTTNVCTEGTRTGCN